MSKKDRNPDNDRLHHELINAKASLQLTEHARLDMEAELKRTKMRLDAVLWMLVVAQEMVRNQEALIKQYETAGRVSLAI